MRSVYMAMCRQLDIYCLIEFQSLDMPPSHVFMIISSSSSITFSRNTTFSIYISFDCWDAPPCSALLCCQSYIINTYTYTEWPTERFAYRRVKSFIVSSDNGWKATRRILATFLLFISNVCIFIGKKKKTLKYELALCVIHFCVCVCVLRFHCERGFSEKWTRPLIFRWRGSIKKDFNPPFASLSVYRRDFFSPGSIWTKRLERPERKKKLMDGGKGQKGRSTPSP